MTDTSNLRIDISPTNPGAALSAAIVLDGNTLCAVAHVDQLFSYQQDFPDDDAEHELCIVMSNKTAADTQIDSAGNIVNDAMLDIQAYVDNVNVNEILYRHGIYTHDFNGSQPEIQDTFHGLMGCNGILRLKICTPLFLWVLANRPH